MHPLKIEILDETRTMTEEELGWVLRSATAAIQRLGSRGEVRIRVVGDEAMAAAHVEFAGVEGTTDVLTFDMSEPESGVLPALPTPEQVSLDDVRGLDGLDTDILICIDEAKRQAAGRGYSFDRELLLYILHGVLHCLGFDDHEEATYEAMHAMEDAVLAAIGVGPVFHRPFVGDPG
ncbi:MAG: rRNA maturation RNase YbeY [Planctomycetota bacterium]|nr:rRNA maturation RNase YbeY [Planctomycetota bacterium]